MIRTLTAVFVAVFLSFPATYFAAALYLIAIDPRSGIASAFSGAILALTAPFVYVPPAAAVGVLASILNRLAFRTRATSLGLAAAFAGSYVGWRETCSTPAIPTAPAMIAAGAIWPVIAFAAIHGIHHRKAKAHTVGSAA